MGWKMWNYLQLSNVKIPVVDLTKTLHSFLAELAETGKSTVKNTLADILEEL